MALARTLALLAIALVLHVVVSAQGANAKPDPKSPTADQLPIYEIDPTWPPTLPNNWIWGDIRGLFVDDRDHLWVIHMPSSLTDQEIGAAAKPPIADCCFPAPPVLELDPDGREKRIPHGGMADVDGGTAADLEQVARTGRWEETVERLQLEPTARSQISRAAAVAEQIFLRNPQDFRAVYSYAELLFLSGRNQDALATLTKVRAEDPQFFKRLSQLQAPKYLWIGCSDSRVPANQITGLQPGEVFVHRNIANVVVHTDLNCLSTIQFAVDVLKVEHILVVGHYGCGGVHAALTGTRVGLADNWLRHVADVAHKHAGLLAEVDLESLRHARLCELNVLEQVVNVCQTTIVQDAWARGQELHVHGWIYGIHDGLLRDLNTTVAAPDEAPAVYQAAVRAL